MKRFLGLSLVCVAVAAVSFSHIVRAHDDDDDDRRRKVTICHVQASHTLSNGIMRFCGTVITVPLRAAIAHHRAHGDVLIEDSAVEGARCIFSVLPDGTVVPGFAD